MQAYIDASGTQAPGAGPLLCAAGFVARDSTWVAFARDWTETLTRYGVEQFSMADCAHSTGLFVSWKGDEKRRRSFLIELVDVAASHELTGVGSAIRNSDFHALNLEYHAEPYLSGPYSICAALAADRLRSSGIVNVAPRRKLEIFVERGDCGQSDLVDLMQRDVRKQVPIIIPKRKQNTQGLWQYVRPFELADMLAYEARLTLARMGDGKPVRGIAQYMEDKLAPKLGFTRLEGMRDVCAAVGIPRRDDRVHYARRRHEP